MYLVDRGDFTMNQLRFCVLGGWCRNNLIYCPRHPLSKINGSIEDCSVGTSRLIHNICPLGKYVNWWSNHYSKADSSNARRSVGRIQDGVDSDIGELGELWWKVTLEIFNLRCVSRFHFIESGLELKCKEKYIHPTDSSITVVSHYVERR